MNAGIFVLFWVTGCCIWRSSWPWCWWSILRSGQSNLCSSARTGVIQMPVRADQTCWLCTVTRTQWQQSWRQHVYASLSWVVVFSWRTEVRGQGWEPHEQLVRIEGKSWNQSCFFFLPFLFPSHLLSFPPSSLPSFLPSFLLPFPPPKSLCLYFFQGLSLFSFHSCENLNGNVSMFINIENDCGYYNFILYVPKEVHLFFKKSTPVPFFFFFF